MNMNRRELLGAAAAATAASMVPLAGCNKESRMPSRKTLKLYDNATFYTEGKFDMLKAKKAYYELMQFHGYPISDVLRTEEFWVCDFVQGDFARLGMGGIFWINAHGTYGQSGSRVYDGPYKDDKYGYLGHDIFLLPGQMLPEHRHVGGEQGYGPKMESWHVRHGSVEFFGEYPGEGTETPIARMPEKDRPWGYGQEWFKSRYVIGRTAQSGQVYTLQDPESWHGQRAGAQGAIVTEYATYHNHVTFSKPGMVFASTGQS